MSEENEVAKDVAEELNRDLSVSKPEPAEEVQTKLNQTRANNFYRDNTVMKLRTILAEQDRAMAQLGIEAEELKLRISQLTDQRNAVIRAIKEAEHG